MPPPTQASPWPPQPTLPYPVQQRLDALIDSWLDRDRDHGDDPSGDAVKAALAAFMETPRGKQLKDLILSNRALPMTLMVVGTALVGMAADNADIPSPPGVERGGAIIKLDINGKFASPKGVVLTISVPWGSGPEAKPRPKPGGTPLPGRLHEQVAGQVDEDLLRKWVVKQAAWESETAGPDEEAKKRRLASRVKDPDATPDAQLVAEELARALIDAGKRGQKRVELNLHYDEIWDGLSDLRGLAGPLQALVRTLAGLMPEAEGIESVAFRCGKRSIPIVVQGTAK